MDETTARGIIRRLALKHKEFVLVSENLHSTGLFITFEFIDMRLDTISNWIYAAGGTPLRVGVQGTGDRQVLTAEIR